MLRKFIQCRSNVERLEFVRDSKAEEWTASQLDTALEIVGLNRKLDNFDNEEKRVTLFNILSSNINDSEEDNRIFMDNLELDKPVENQTVYGTLKENDEYRRAVALAFVNQATVRIG